MSQYFEAARVGSWLGWIFNFAFGSVIFGASRFEITAVVFVAFSLATASVFVLNQYLDREADRENEVKSNLPVASGRLTPRRALIFSFLLVISCLFLVIMANNSVLPLFIVYLGLWTAYSTPPFRLKSVPVADFLISGVGAGFLPFLIGGGLTEKLISNIPSLVLGAMPLMLIQCGGHIIQAVGDYEADRKTGVRTFVVRYGRKNGVVVAGFMFLIASFSPFVYSAFGLLPLRHLFLILVLLPLSIPIIKRYADLLKNPSTNNVINVQKTTRKHGLIGITLVWVYALLTKTVGF
ncbi:MAG: UbiA prenyltransferase family protein [Candidatus Bathyarchaeota archaeon]|nr:UbiA prenyltransferase family protein [Candidatus Bathyarchaeota archaeon]